VSTDGASPATVAGDADVVARAAADGESVEAPARSRSRRGRRRRSRPAGEDGGAAQASQEQPMQTAADAAGGAPAAPGGTPARTAAAVGGPASQDEAAAADDAGARPLSDMASVETTAGGSRPAADEASSGSSRPRTRRGRRRKKAKAEGPVAEAAGAHDVQPGEAAPERSPTGQPDTVSPAAETVAEAAPEEKKKRRRRKKAKAEGPVAEAAAAHDVQPGDAAPERSPAGQPDTCSPAAVTVVEPAAEEKKKKRRRAAAPAGESEEHAVKGEAPRPRRRSRTKAKAAAAEFSERIVLASEDLGDLRVAVVEDGRLAAVYLQRQERPSILGNIYQARVQSVLKGMDASFIDFGLEKNGFLHVDEVTLPDEEGGKRSRRITQLLQSGQEILVQVTKDPMKGKGARLTTRVSLPGRYLVYVPGGSGVGVSRRLDQDERDRLRDLCKQLRPRNAGLIVRTVAEGQGLEELRRDLQYLSRLWSRIKTKAGKTAAPALIYEEADVALTAARDLVDEACTRFVIDSPKVRKRVVAYLERVAPQLVDRVVLYEGDQPLFEEYGVEDGIDATLARRAPLPSGGNLVIDHTEALTVVDVNSGKYTGGKGLEETITRTNLEAAEELVRQLRLRDIGGIIVIDFIDMARRENREAVLQKLEGALARDKTKTYVVEISPLGLVEMTRQSTTNGTRGLMTVTCPTCNGTARVLTAESMVRDVERLLVRTLPAAAGEAALIEVRRDVADKLMESERLKRLERQHGKRLFFEGSAQLPVDTFRIVSSGPLRTVQGQRLPVREGQELEVELLHTLPHSPRDAVAVVDGYSIVVRNGRPHLGARRRVRVATALRSGGVADFL
jgi:ribonuclease G